MKAIILLLLGTALAAFGLSVDALFYELAGMVSGVILLTEALNTWLDWHKAKAVLATIGVSVVVCLVGWKLIAASFLYGVETMELIYNMVIVSLGALGLWPQYKKAVESV